MPRGIIKEIEKSGTPGQWSLTFENGRHCWIDKEMKNILEKTFDNPRGKAIRYHLNNKLFMLFFQKGW